VLYGRDAERDAIGALLEAARASRSGALVIRGEPGAGKTALLQDARDRAADMNVLAVRGIESESELPFAGLHQFVRPALDLVDRLPEPQSRALEAALGLAESTEDDRFLVSAACLTLLSELGEQRPVLCLVDDAQWLDTPSADALLFVARRLDAEGVVMLFGVRDSGDGHGFEARDLSELELPRLDADAAALVVARGANASIAPAVCEALVRQADGNALALVELPAALTPGQLTGADPLPEALPLTRVEHVYLERVRRLARATQRLLLLVAADETGRLGTIMTAAEALGAHEQALDEAERSGLIAVHGSEIDVRHPLVRSAVYQAASSSERRAAHLALADAVQDADRRTWHLAAGALGPDEEVASALEASGAAARERAAFGAAAAAYERAATLTTTEAKRLERLYRAAEASWHAGHGDHAVALARRALPDAVELGLRADLMHLIGHIEHFGRPLMPTHDLLTRAAELIADADPAKASSILSDAFEACLFAGDAKAALVAAQRARELAPSDGSVADYLADLNLAEALFINGRGGDGAAHFERAVELFHREDALREDVRLATRAAIALCWLERSEEARTIVLPAVASARARGEIAVLPYALFIVAWAARRTGNWQEARLSASEGVQLARELGQHATMAQCMQELGVLAASQGREEDARRHVEEGTSRADGVGARYVSETLRAQLGLLELGLGENERAVLELEGSAERLQRMELRLHDLVPAPDLVEALMRLGRVDEARAALDLVWTGSNPRTAQAILARCRGLVADDDSFGAHFTESLELHPDGEDVFAKARTHLAFGERLRRARRRVEAREHLRLALETFEQLDAAPWAARAGTELRASGETARRRDPSTVTELTPQELQVARLVGEGLSNKEVAAQLFLSPRTIDAHLRNVFSKLGITSRTQLARLPF